MVERIEGVLESVGVGAEEEQVYVALLRDPGRPITRLASQCGLPSSRVRGLLESLERRGLVSRSPSGTAKFFPTPPQTAVEVLVLQRQEELERTRLAATELERVHRVREQDPIRLVEVVTGREAIRQRWLQLERTAKRELVAFDRPPYMNPPSEQTNPPEDAGLQKGVRFRVVYDHSALAYPGYLRIIEGYVADGEEARVVPELPMKLDIIDSSAALVPFDYEGPGPPTALIVQARSLVRALAMLFETVWQRATPFGKEPDPPEPGGLINRPETLTLLNLLAAGLKDEVIARQLDIDLRTVGRRIRRIMDEFGATSRFQLGLQLGARGGLNEKDPQTRR